MLCVDVNVLVYSHRPESPEHGRYKAWLEDHRNSHQPIGLLPVVCSGFLRVVTHPRIFREPTPPADAFDFVRGLRLSPSVLTVTPGDRHWTIFEELCAAVEAKGNVVPDAFLAAAAIEQGATWVTADHGFARFPGLRILNPLD